MTANLKLPKTTEIIHQELFDRYGMPSKFSKKELLELMNSIKSVETISSTEEKMKTIRYQPSLKRWKRSSQQK